MNRAVLLIALAALVLAPGAAAHTTVTTTDGKYFVTVGNLNEPVTTFTKTGLDLIVRSNQSGVRGPGISGLHLTLNATLLAPGGQELAQPLRAQFGVSGGYSFTEPYYLTQPGEYKLRVTGRINDTQVNFAGILVGSGPIPDMAGKTFPDDVSTPKELEERVKMLETQNAQLKSQVDALKQQMSATTSAAKGDAPGADAMVLLAAIFVAGAFLLRRRAA